MKRPRLSPAHRWLLAPLLLFANVARSASAAPQVELPDGLELIVAAASPLVRYPLMGCFDDRGRLFIGDAAGRNMNKQELESQLPNRVLVLEDVDGDGRFDRSTVFADRMTFPNGGVWLDGSLYIASPPGIWKLTDTNGDSVADQREMIVGGFDGYSGNATNVHGPFLHPTNGRLLWCNGGTGRVVQKDGTLVREGKLTGVWSCRPDGSDIQWHSLGAMNNPVEIDFTREGEIVGVVNLHQQHPRTDTLVHWLKGGVYERPDWDGVRSSGLADLPRTLRHMPIIHNFGHVAVSGFTRYRSGALNEQWKDSLFVPFFNTQKIVRVQLTPAGATYAASEHPFLKVHDPGVHFTDIIEDADGSLVVLDTGGWFSRGCPSSLGGRAEVHGAVYRIRGGNMIARPDPRGMSIDWAALAPGDLTKLLDDDRWMVREKAAGLRARAQPAVPAVAGDLLAVDEPHRRLRAAESFAQSPRLDESRRHALRQMLGEPLEPVLEHAALFAAITTRAFGLDDLRRASSPLLVQRLMMVLDQTAQDPATQDGLLAVAKNHVAAPDASLARTAVAILVRNPRVLELCTELLHAPLAAALVPPATLHFITETAKAHLGRPPAQQLVTAMLQHSSPGVQRAAWQIIAGQFSSVKQTAWHAPLHDSLVAAEASARAADLSLLVDAVTKLRSDYFDPVLNRLITDGKWAAPLRLKALAALSRPGEPLNGETYALLLDLSGSDSSPVARMDAARFLTRANLSAEQLRSLAPILATAGPVELEELLKLKTKLDAATARLWAASVARSPVLGSIDESVIRSGFQRLPAADYERLLGPAVRAAAGAGEAKRRRLETLAADAARGRASAGRQVFAGSSCVACHVADGLGRAVGPDLSRIGQIRRPRDLLESILLPDATLAQGYETHLIETGDGRQFVGHVKSDTQEGVVLLDPAGQETRIPQAEIVGQDVLSTSLMPAGLEEALTEQQILDLVAWLLSLK